MANKQRGQVDIVLGGKTYTLHPSFDALCAIEERTGTGAMPLLARFLNMRFGVNDAFIIIGECLKASGEKIPDDLGDLIMAAGLSNLAKDLMSLMTYAVAGDKPLQKASGETAPGEAKAEA